MDKFHCIVNEIKEQAGMIKERFLDEIKEGKPVIFGSGECGHRIYNLLCCYNKNILCFCDNGMAGTVDKSTGIKIICPEELKDLVSNPAILVCVGSEDARQSICQQLLSLGFENTQIHMMNEYIYWQTGGILRQTLKNTRKHISFWMMNFLKQYTWKK